MAIRTVDEYLESIRDDREVWFDGERVKDVTTHRSLRTAVKWELWTTASPMIQNTRT